MQCLLGTFRWKNKVFKTYFSGDGNLTQSLVYALPRTLPTELHCQPTYFKKYTRWVWWHKPKMPAGGRERKEQEFRHKLVLGE